jgi:GT2 family glycosyltransferase
VTTDPSTASPQSRGPATRASEVEISFCVVNTAQRELLGRCLDAIAREREQLPFATEVLVLDNASGDGSAEAARAHRAAAEVIALPRRHGKAANDSELMRRARGRYCLLLNEDSELLPGAATALHAALAARADAAVAGATLRRPDARPQPSAWRFPSPVTALAGAVFAHRWLVVQSADGDSVELRAGSGDQPALREVDWVQSAAMLVRREAAAGIGFMDERFFVYSEEVDFCRRLRDSGWRTLHVPAAVAVHHEQLASGAVPARRIVEFARNRDRYMRKHHSPAAALAVRWLTAWAYALRVLAAVVLPGHDPRRYWRHVIATLRPERGEGLREAAEAHNRALDRS